MGNYYATARSNYFKVKDDDEFKRFITGRWGNSISFWEKKDKKGEVSYAVYSDESGGWPSGVWNDEESDFDQADFFKEIAKHLRDGQVAIFMETGAEKMRYLIGYSLAINNKLEVKIIDIENIYEEASILGNAITRAEY